MNLCKNCKFWDNKIVWSIYDGFGECKSNNLTYRDEQKDPVDDNMLVYYDGDYHQSELRTGPNFGCIHWAGKS